MEKHRFSSFLPLFFPAWAASRCDLSTSNKPLIVFSGGERRASLRFPSLLRSLPQTVWGGHVGSDRTTLNINDWPARLSLLLHKSSSQYFPRRCRRYLDGELDGEVGRGHSWPTCPCDGGLWPPICEATRRYPVWRPLTQQPGRKCGGCVIEFGVKRFRWRWFHSYSVMGHTYFSSNAV